MQKRMFNPRSFFRKLRPEIKKRLLGQLTLLPLMEKHKSDDDPEQDRSYFAWARVPEKLRKASDRDLVRINDMACEKGRFYLDPVVLTVYADQPELLEQAQDMTNHDLAATVFIEDQAAFERAYAEFAIDDHTYRMKRQGKDDSMPVVKPKFKDSIRHRIELFYKEAGKGRRRCQVEDYEDDERLAVLVHHERRATYKEEFDEEGKLVSAERKPVSMAMAVYHKHIHILMVSVREKALRDEMIGLMGEFYFADRRHFDDPYAREFDLSVLADPNLKFPFKASDGIGAVSVSEITFQHPSADLGLLTVQCPHGIHAALRALNTSPDSVTFEGVRILVQPDGYHWKYQRTIVIKLPDWWNLNYTPRDRLLAAYVDKWGLFAKIEEKDDAEEAVADVEELGELFRTRVANRLRGNGSRLAH